MASRTTGLVSWEYMGDGVLCISATRTGRAGVLVGSISRMWTSSLLALGLVAFALLVFAVFRSRKR